MSTATAYLRVTRTSQPGDLVLIAGEPCRVTRNQRYDHLVVVSGETLAIASDGEASLNLEVF